MKKLIVISIIYLIGLSVFAQGLLQNRRNNFNTSSAVTGFYPTNVVNTVAFWNYHDIPLGLVNSWTDEVSGIVLTNIGGCSASPTNTGMGVYFSGTESVCPLTNATFTTSSGFSMWIVAANWYPAAGRVQIYGNNGSSTLDAIVFNTTTYSPSNLVDGYWGSDNFWKGHWFGYNVDGQTITNSPLWYDIVDSQGAIYLNGSATSGNIGTPSGTMSWQSMGGNVYNGNQLLGSIKYLLIAHDHAITSAEATNLYIWEQTNGVTNVNGGIVAWWKFADSTSGSTLSDSSGNNLTATLTGSPKPIWTNALNNIVTNALAFDGVQNYATAPFSLSSFTNTQQITISCWFLYTNQSLQNSFFTTEVQGNPALWYLNGAQFGEDCGTTAIRGQVLSTVSSSGTQIDTNPENLCDGKWHHFCYATDGVNMYSWVDGFRDTTGPPSEYVPPLTGWYDAITSFQFSGSFCSTGYMQGSVTDVRVYNRILNDAEVDILYRAPTADYLIGAYNY